MLRTILPYAKSYTKQFILGPIFKLMEAICELCLPLLLAQLIDQGILTHHSSKIWQYTFWILILSFLGLGCVFICQYMASIASQGFGTQLRTALFKHIQHLPESERQSIGTESLITRLIGDVNQIQQAVAMLIRLVIRAPFLSIGSIIMAFHLNAKLAWIFIIILPAFSILLIFIMRQTVPIFKHVQSIMDKFNQIIEDNFSGIRVIHTFNQRQTMTNKGKKTSQDIAYWNEQAGKVASLLNPGTQLMINLGIVILVLLAKPLLQTNHLQAGVLVAMINYMSQMLLALIVIANLVVTFTKAYASLQRVHDVFELDEQEDRHAVISHIESIHINHIDYRYSDNQNTLENIDLTINQSDTIGIIGATGSGKTTLMKLIAQILTPTIGTININHTLSLNDVQNWHALVHYVPQKAVLFKGTIRSNLLWQNSNATDADLKRALHMAGADFIWDLPEQLDTPVSLGGKNFSGGQRQRLTIARALVTLPEILLLDDALSALDYQTEAHILEQLQTIPNLTTIIVSQRYSSIKHAKHLIVLEEGKIAASGTPHTLQHPFYLALVAQAKEENAC